MKPGLRQIQIVPFDFCEYLMCFHIVKSYSKNLNRTAVSMSINAVFIFNSLFEKNPGHPMGWKIRRFQPKL